MEKRKSRRIEFWFFGRIFLQFGPNDRHERKRKQELYLFAREKGVLLAIDAKLEVSLECSAYTEMEAAMRSDERWDDKSTTSNVEDQGNNRSSVSDREEEAGI